LNTLRHVHETVYLKNISLQDRDIIDSIDIDAPLCPPGRFLVLISVRG
jgi:hypothetical protein